MKTRSSTKKISMPDCDNDSANEAIADGHAVLQTTLNTMITDFFGSVNAAPIDISINDPSIDYTKDCKIYGVKIVINPANHNDNTDIRVSMCLFSDLQKPHTDHFIMHSLHFMKALRDKKLIKTLKLSKAYRVEDGQNIPTVAIKGINNKGVEAYWGDLSSMIPLIGSEK